MDVLTGESRWGLGLRPLTSGYAKIHPAPHVTDADPVNKLIESTDHNIENVKGNGKIYNFFFVEKLCVESPHDAGWHDMNGSPSFGCSELKTLEGDSPLERLRRRRRRVVRDEVPFKRGSQAPLVFHIHFHKWRNALVGEWKSEFPELNQCMTVVEVLIGPKRGDLWAQARPECGLCVYLLGLFLEGVIELLMLLVIDWLTVFGGGGDPNKRKVA